MYLWWRLCTLLCTHMPGESYRRLLRSLLLCLWDVFRVLIKSPVCWFFLKKQFTELQPLFIYLTLTDPSTFPIARTLSKLVCVLHKSALQIFREASHLWQLLDPRTFKEDRLALPLSTPLSSRRSMSLALCPQVVCQVPHHFRSSEKQATCESCLTRQSICSVVSLHSGMSRAVHTEEF